MLSQERECHVFRMGVGEPGVLTFTPSGEGATPFGWNPS
jgi:hypothetical protein